MPGPAPPTREVRRQLLRRVAIFASLSDAELDALTTGTRTLRAREQLFREGDPPTSAFVLVSGRLKVSMPTLAGHTLVIDYLEPGKVIGELALIDGVHRSATVSAVVTSRLLAIERRNFLAFLARHPASALALLTELARKIRQFNQSVQESHASSLADRLARKLIALGQRFGAPGPDGLLIDLHLPQRELGDLIGYSRESVNKQLRAWSAAGVVGVGRGRIVIRDVAALARAIDIQV